MSDWFKVYEDELDREEFTAAWDECNSLPVVLLWLRCQATKAKSERVIISSRYQLIGLAKKLRVTEHEVKRAFELLHEIKYIRLTEQEIIITNWEKHQSKYLYELQRKQKALESPSNPPDGQDLPTNSPQTTLRGEEIRRDKRRVERSKEKQKEDERIKKYGLDAPHLLNAFERIKGIFINYKVKLTSPVSSLMHLRDLLKVDTEETIITNLERALVSPLYQSKLLSSWGLINFAERYQAIKAQYKAKHQPTTQQTYKPVDISGVPCPEHVKIKMQALIK
jgi:hypothetical protein